jgi:hypothetical protein
MEKEVQSYEGFGDISNVSKVLKEAFRAIKDNDWTTLKNISNSTIHSATVHQDSMNIIIAVLVYATSKILQRENYQKMPGWKEFHSSLLKNWEMMVKASEKKDMKIVVQSAGDVRNALNKIEGDLGSYIREVFRKAEINKAFKLYEHGLSSAQTAELLGISLWDLASYIGQSSINEARINMSMPVQNRIKKTEEFFG